jgi:hypothetical protein
MCAILSIGPLGCSLIGRLTGRDARPAEPAAAAPAVPETSSVDRVVVRWYAPETGGVTKPQFIFARELSFEARLEALADPDPDGATYRDRHVRAALDRHIAETLLASLPTMPEPKAAEITQRTDSARVILEQRVGGGNPALGRDRLASAAASEGLSAAELEVILRRQARASLYLDRMVAPMLEPTELELLALHRSGGTPFSDKPFDDVKDRMKRWYVSVRLSQALETYYQNARSRVSIVTVKRP